MLNPAVPWKEQLQEFLHIQSRDDYSWLRPNRDYLPEGIVIPSLGNMEIGDVVFVDDTSGSMTVTGVTAFEQSQAEIVEILDELRPPTLYAIYVDTHVRRVEEWHPDDEVKMEPEGGGGTDFRPAFKWLEENDIDPACLIYLTDMRCSHKRWPDEPDYPVLWLQWGDYDAPEPLFGTLVDMDIGNPGP